MGNLAQNVLRMGSRRTRGATAGRQSRRSAFSSPSKASSASRSCSRPAAWRSWSVFTRRRLCHARVATRRQARAHRYTPSCSRRNCARRACRATAVAWWAKPPHSAAIPSIAATRAWQTWRRVRPARRQCATTTRSHVRLVFHRDSYRVYAASMAFRQYALPRHSHPPRARHRN